MGDRPELARLATDLLAAESFGPIAPAAPDREIAAIEREIERSRQRRRVRTGGIVGGLVVAAAAAAFFVLHTPKTNAPVAPSDDDDIVLADGAEQIGARIVTHEGHAMIAAKSGTRVAIDAHGDVDLERSNAMRKLSLHEGALEAHVAKLAAGNRFVVTTVDAEIEVRGTAFRVTVADAATCGTRTSVTVSEGTVWVRHGGAETVVEAGGAWPKCEAAIPTSSGGPTPVVIGTAPAPAASFGAVKQVATPRADAISTSDLAEQNRIFEEAVTAKRRGDIPRAQAAARDYLARYPNGFAAAEARAMLSP